MGLSNLTVTLTGQRVLLTILDYSRLRSGILCPQRSGILVCPQGHRKRFEQLAANPMPQSRAVQMALEMNFQMCW